MKNLLTVLFVGLALLVAPAATMGQMVEPELNDSQEPGSVLVFPKFLRGTVATPDQGTLARTEIEISATCPRGATCVDGQAVIHQSSLGLPSGTVRRPAGYPLPRDRLYGAYDGPRIAFFQP